MSGINNSPSLPSAWLVHPFKRNAMDVMLTTAYSKKVAALV
jgi:hypothetical protein